MKKKLSVLYIILLMCLSYIGLTCIVSCSLNKDLTVNKTTYDSIPTNNEKDHIPIIRINF